MNTVHVMKIYCICFLFFLVFGSLGNPSPAWADLCPDWGKSALIGQVDTDFLDEASGLVASRRFPNRLYHVNDSGGGAFFYTTDFKGRGTVRVKIKGFSPRDTEDLALGPCGNGNSCLVIGDIGDNSRKRKNIQLVLVEEEEKFAASVDAFRILKLTYPDGPHNAESLAMHPNGDIFILTKEDSKSKRETYPSILFRLKRETWEKRGEEAMILEKIGEIDMPYLAYQSGFYGRLPTSMDIHPKGKRLLILTYDEAYEFSVDLSKRVPRDLRKLQKGIDYQKIKIKRLRQQEAVAYLPDGMAFLYDTEREDKGEDSPLMKVVCRISDEED